MSTRRVFGVEIDTTGFEEWLRGARMGFFKTEPVAPERIPDGWHLPDRRWPTGRWRRTGYWVSIWRDGGKRGENVTIMPQAKGWYVDYDPENSWSGGFLLGPSFDSYQDALAVALDAMERMENGADYADIRYDYDEDTATELRP